MLEERGNHKGHRAHKANGRFSNPPPTNPYSYFAYFAHFAVKISEFESYFYVNFVPFVVNPIFQNPNAQPPLRGSEPPTNAPESG